VRYIRSQKLLPSLEIREVGGDGNCFWSSISVRASFSNSHVPDEGRCSVLLLSDIRCKKHVDGH
jgi:hypothetical protein